MAKSRDEQILLAFKKLADQGKKVVRFKDLKDETGFNSGSKLSDGLKNLKFHSLICKIEISRSQTRYALMENNDALEVIGGNVRGIAPRRHFNDVLKGMYALLANFGLRYYVQGQLIPDSRFIECAKMHLSTGWKLKKNLKVKEIERIVENLHETSELLGYCNDCKKKVIHL